VANRHVLVTTEHRGVFVGCLSKPSDYERDARRIVLQDVKNVIRWEGRRGFLGLASHGPESGSRIGAQAKRVDLHGVTSVTDCTPEAWRTFLGFADDK